MNIARQQSAAASGDEDTRPPGHGLSFRASTGQFKSAYASGAGSGDGSHLQIPEPLGQGAQNTAGSPGSTGQNLLQMNQQLILQHQQLLQR